MKIILMLEDAYFVLIYMHFMSYFYVIAITEEPNRVVWVHLLRACLF